MKTILSLSVFILCFAHCTPKVSHSNIEKIVWSDNRENHIMPPSSFDFLEIHPEGDYLFVDFDSKKIRLKEEITPFTFNRSGVIYHPDLGRLLVIEYYYEAPSGKIARIINTIVYSIHNNELEEIFSFNSFYSGIDALAYYKNGFSVSVFDLIVNDEERREYYCRNKFSFVNGVTSAEGTVDCVSIDDQGIFTKKLDDDSCKCENLSNPTVFPHE